MLQRISDILYQQAPALHASPDQLEGGSVGRYDLSPSEPSELRRGAGSSKAVHDCLSTLGTCLRGLLPLLAFRLPKDPSPE